MNRRIVGQGEAKTAQNTQFWLKIFGVLGNSIERLYIGQHVFAIILIEMDYKYI